jgi:hypothetical protein
MHVNVLLAWNCKQAWCAKLCWIVKSIGYMEGRGAEARLIEEVDVSRPHDRSKAVQPLMGCQWIVARRTRELAVTTKQATYVDVCVDNSPTRPLGEGPELHGYLKTGMLDGCQE